VTVTATIYDPTNTTEVTAGGLADSLDRSWQDVRSEPGAGGLTVQNDDADRAECTFGRVIRFAIDGATKFAALIEAKTVASVARGEEAEEATEIKGRGTMARWEDLVVYPEGGLGGTLIGDTRFFNFASSYFDDSGWATVDAIDLETAEQAAPANWPDTTTKKIRPGGSPTVDRDPEEYGVRKVFATTGGDKTYRLFFTGDDGVDIFLNGVRIVEEVRPRMWQETRQADVRLRDDAAHLIAIKGTNVDFPGDNYSWVAAALYNIEPDGTLGTLVVQTDATWVGVQFGDTPPGFTPHRVLEILLDEAQARGAVPELTLGGTNAADVDAVAWPVAPDIAFRIGLDGLSVLRQLAESYIDCAMDPESMRLDIWAHGGKGTASGVVLAAGVNLTEAVHDVVAPDLSVALGRWAGGWHEVPDAVLIAANGRREGFLSSGDAQSVAELERIGSGLIAGMGAPAERIRLAVEPVASDVPYDDFGIGDTLTAPNHLGAATTWRVKGITVTEDPEGNPFYVPELESA
jgi:hypothetical protein